MVSLPRFFVYVLARPDGTPFYVGKGSGRRIEKHEYEARSGHRCYKCNIIRKIWRKGGKFQCYTVFTTDDEAEAYAVEAETIAMYGLDTLANQVVGGVGGSKGRVCSDAERAAMRVRIQKQMEDPEFRAKWESAQKGLRSPESTAKRREVQNRPESRARLSAAMKKRNEDPAYIAQLSAQMKLRMSDPDAVQRISDHTKELWADPGHRAMRLAAQRQTLDDPVYRQSLSDMMLERWKEPAYREKATEANVRRFGYTYTITSPDGQVFTTDSLNAFSIEHHLDCGALSRVARGIWRQTKGWTVTREKTQPLIE